MFKRLPLADLLITLVFLAVGVSAVTNAFEWPFRAGLFPLATGTFLSAAAALKLLVDLVGAWRGPKAEPPRVHVEDEATEPELEDVFETATRQEWLAALGWMTGFFVMLWFLGALVTVPLYALIYLLVVSRESVLLSGIYAFCCWLFIYGLFDRLLHIPLPAGALLSAIGL